MQKETGFISRPSCFPDVLIGKPKLTQPFNHVVIEAILDRLKLVPQKRIAEQELLRRMVGRYFELKMAQEIPCALSVNQFRTVTNIDKLVETKINGRHVVPDVFFYDVAGMRKTHPVYSFHTIGEIKGLTIDEGLWLVKALDTDHNKRQNRVSKAIKDGGFPLEHRDKYDQTQAIPLRFNPGDSKQWTKGLFQLVDDKSITLSDQLGYCLLLPCDTHDAIIKWLTRRVQSPIDYLNQLFQQLGVDRIERMPYSREEADRFAYGNLDKLKERVLVRYPNLKIFK